MPSEQFGRILPIKKKATGDILGVKIVPFKESGRGLDFELTAIVWRREVEDVLNGRISTGTVFKSTPLPSVDEVAPVAAKVQSRTR